MRKHEEFMLVTVVLLCSVIGPKSLCLCDVADYPCFYYFERPEMPEIHCAFADAEGGVIISTGDWWDYRGEYPDYSYYYWSEGIYRLRGDRADPITSPSCTFVIDGAVDGSSRTWVLEAKAVDEHGAAPAARDGSSIPETQGCDIGYRYFRWPTGRWSDLRDWRFATVEEDGLLEQPDLSYLIPGEPVLLTSDPAGRIYVLSWERDNFVTVEFHISWWKDDPLASLQVLDLHQVFANGTVRDYPRFGPDGLAYFTVRHGTDRDEYAVLALDPETEQTRIYSGEDYPFLDAAIHYFCVDSMNVKWFGTEAGFVRYDGSDWTRFTTDNTELPHNLVCQMEYDEIDNVYYVVTQSKSDDYQTAFTILTSDGRRLGEPLRFPDNFYPWVLPRISRDARDVWWLISPYNNSSTAVYDVYAYDHHDVYHWDTREWFDRQYAYIEYIGSDALGRTFCVGPTCVMIW